MTLTTVHGPFYVTDEYIRPHTIEGTYPEVSLLRSIVSTAHKIIENTLASLSKVQTDTVEI